MGSVYILNLVEENKYIGSTIDTDIRLNTHFSIGGSLFTKKYKPLNVDKIINKCANKLEDEDLYTLLYMKKFGIDKVRGGKYCKECFSESDKEKITELMESIEDTCKICNVWGHFPKDCSNLHSKTNDKKCNRCNRTNHTTENCLAISYDNKKTRSLFEDRYDDELSKEENEELIKAMLESEDEWLKKLDEEIEEINAEIERIDSIFQLNTPEEIIDLTISDESTVLTKIENDELHEVIIDSIVSKARKDNKLGELAEFLKLFENT